MPANDHWLYNTIWKLMDYIFRHSYVAHAVTERLTTEHEVGGSNHRQTDVLKSEEKNWKKLKSVSYVVCCLGRLMEDRCSNEDELGT